MSVYYRYQAVYGAEQHLYCNGCPVYVHRYQISSDLQTGGKVLQVRMVNMSEQEIDKVFLRIACLDGQGKALSTMYAVPMGNLKAARGGIFGESIPLQLSTAQTQLVQVFPERVVFSNGSAWNETEAAAYVSLPAPFPVRKTDVDYTQLNTQAQRNGVHNDYRYQELENAWYCTCGLPNSLYRQFCGYCGTNREWLRLNMNGRAPAVRPEQKPTAAAVFSAAEISAPEKSPSPDITRTHKRPERLKASESAPKPASEIKEEAASVPAEDTSVDLSNNASVAELLEYMNSKLDRYSLPAKVAEKPDAIQIDEEFPVIDSHPVKENHIGKILGISLLVLAVVAVIAFCVLCFFRPMLRYNEANALEAAGEYAQAREIFTELGSYQDSQRRVSGTWYQEALAKMCAGDYEGAYQLFTGIYGYENSTTYAADCIYSLGVLAFNDGDTATAWEYVEKLHNEFPDYDGGEDLYQSCCYALGNDAVEAQNFEDAYSWFSLAGEYKNSADLLQYCTYELACAARDSGDYIDAVERFKTCTYGDSADQVNSCMMLYVENNGSHDDNTTEEYLDALCAIDYPGAAAKYDELYSWSVDIKVSTVAQYSEQLTSAVEADDLNKLYIHYAVKGGHPGEKLGIILIYTLPDGSGGDMVLTNDAEDGVTATLTWADLQMSECTEEGTLKLKFCNTETGDELYSCSVVIREAKS